MNRTLQILNFSGVLALGVLCGYQWLNNRNANLRVIALERSMLDQTAKLAERDKTIQGNAADIEDFRRRLTETQDALQQGEAKIKANAAEIARLTSQRDELQQTADGLRKNIEQWTAAVAERDKAMRTADEQLQKLAVDRNEVVSKFNELAAAYNTAQDQIKQASAQIQKVVADRDDVVRKFNDLAAKYNSLANPVAATQPQPSENRNP